MSNFFQTVLNELNIIDSVMLLSSVDHHHVNSWYLFHSTNKIVQVRLFKESCRLIGEKPKDSSQVSPFQALMVSTASRVGTGNIIGVSTAICLGESGAMFWM